MCGAFTLTEIFTAWEAGAEFIKVFPAEVGGPGYLKAVSRPALPYVRLLPTGGVNLDTLGDCCEIGSPCRRLGAIWWTQEAPAKGDIGGHPGDGGKYVSDDEGSSAKGTGVRLFRTEPATAETVQSGWLKCIMRAGEIADVSG